MIIKFGRQEVERLVRIGLLNSDLLHFVEGTPDVRVYYTEEEGLHCEVTVSWDKQQDADPEPENGGSL